MGIFDKIKTGTGLNYLETEKPKKPARSTSTKSSTREDKDLKTMEFKIQKIIEGLQEIQEKLRVRRGI